MRAESYKETMDELAGWPVKIVSYKLGGAFHVTVHNVQPGAWIAKAEGSTLEEAEKKACADAAEKLAKTRVNPVPGTRRVPGTEDWFRW